jgi:hypothetical protein
VSEPRGHWAGWILGTHPDFVVVTNAKSPRPQHCSSIQKKSSMMVVHTQINAIKHGMTF